jgi:flagellar FliL protein
MSTAAAEASQALDASPKRGGGKKKLLVMLVVALLVLALAGAGVVVFLKKRAARLAEEAEGGETSSQVESAHEKRDAKHAPTFVPLEMFTVNLADREAERYGQIGVTLELDDPKAADDIKAYMPAIRSGVLMLLAHKTSQELLDADGKRRLAFEIKREASRALGIEIDDEPAAKGSAEAASGAAAAKPAKKKRITEPTPIRQVHFSNFIIQ